MESKSTSKNMDCDDSKPITLSEEQADFTTEKVVDSRVSITRSTYSEEKLLQMILEKEEIKIEHFAKNDRLEEGKIPNIRQEGDVLIVPIIEEQVEIIRYYMLKEEIHISKVAKHEPFQESVTLRHQEINITKEEEGK